jgi:membrane peptidoglycan carboxypeptidase
MEIGKRLWVIVALSCLGLGLSLPCAAGNDTDTGTFQTTNQSMWSTGNAFNFTDNRNLIDLSLADHRFYADPGVDPLALFRVAASWMTGHTDGGGSTLDQQLAKNLYTSGHSSFPQIVEQVVLAVKLNRGYSRAEILRLYAEIAYYGHGYYGLESASCGYFGRQPGQLTVVQAAMLAGAVNAPTYDDPLVYPSQARARLVHVIDRMAAVGYLTKAQQYAAFKAPLDLSAVRGCQ